MGNLYLVHPRGQTIAQQTKMIANALRCFRMDQRPRMNCADDGSRVVFIEARTLDDGYRFRRLQTLVMPVQVCL